MQEKDFQSLFETYTEKVAGFFIKFINDGELAKDLSQDIFLKLYEKKDHIETIEDLDGYIYLMCRNLAFDHMRRAAYDQKYRSYILNASSDACHPEIESQIESDFYKKILEHSLEQLPDQQRIIFRLSKYEGLSHQKIAEKLNISNQTVANHLCQALKNIRATASNPDIDLIAIYIGLALL
ncbi:RNA polymerase sigma-70 factor [Membranihabitans marinus]|uniref:RNA polymerase sigma-70 factor n=1 Tax=Membranihabitans marinus TaxID=1227546 RepID=UPI001EFFF2CB|nr:RNA polymerase sigma-70 factor [Membranihabitans marinus]